MALVIDYKSGKRVDSYKVGSWEAENRFQAALYMLVVERLLGLRAAGGVYVPLGKRSTPRGMVADDVERARLGLQGQRPPAARASSGEARLGARRRCASADARMRARRARLRPGRLRLERRLLATPRSAGARREPALHRRSRQRAVARRDGSLLVRAGAGSGKTHVLVERFVRAVLEDGVPVDAILAITFTEKAAAELRTRVRRRFLELGRRASARAAEGAWISTIHGFCARLLRAHALSAGIDPEFRVLGRARGRADRHRRLRRRARGASWATARTPSASSWSPPTRPTGCGDMVRTAYARLRSQGQRRPRLTELPAAARRRPARARSTRRGGRRPARAGRGRRRQDRRQRARKLERCAALLERLPRGRAGRAGRARGACRSAATRRRSARRAVRRSTARRSTAYAALCSAHSASTATTCCCASCSSSTASRYAARQARPLGARLRGPRAARARPARATHAGLRDQYARALRARARGRVPGHEPAAERAARAARRATTCSGSATSSSRSTASATRTSRCSARHGRRRPRAGRAESITVNFRSRGEMLEAIDRCFAGSGGGFEPLRAGAAARAARRRASSRCVELLVADQRQARAGTRRSAGGPVRRRRMHAATPWRAAEARLLAKRIDELRDEGGWELARHRAAAPRHDRHALLRARARGARHPDLRGRRPRLLGAAAGGRPARLLAALANPLDELARLQRARLAARRALARRAGADRAARRERSGRDPWWAAARRRTSWPSCCRPRPPPRGGVRASCSRRERRAGAAGVARDADRPRRHRTRLRPRTCSRCPAAAGGWPTCAS